MIDSGMITSMQINLLEDSSICIDFAKPYFGAFYLLKKNFSEINQTQTCISPSTRLYV